MAGQNTVLTTGEAANTRYCFVISPIGEQGSDIREEADAVLNYIIVPALARIASEGGPVIRAVRSDEIGTPGKIEQQMLKAILSYDLCIVDLSGLNPNVMYELAIAQAAGRPVVLMCRSGEILPFDIKDYRTIEYNLKPRSIKEDTWVPKVIEQILAVLADDYEAPRLLKGYDQSRQDAWSNVLNHQSRRIEYNELVKRTQYRCDMMGISFTSFWLKANQDVLRKLGSRKVPTRILIMSPENPALPHMVAEGRTSASTDLKSSAARMIEFFETVANEYESVETRVIRKGLPHAQLLIIDEAAFVAQYMYAPGTRGPMLRVAKETELYGVFAGEFEQLWRLNESSSEQTG